MHPNPLRALARMAVSLGLAAAARPTGLLAQAVNPPAARAEKNVTTLDKFVVDDTRPTPFTTANVDLPRTIDDVQPYFFFEAQELDRSGAVNLEDFLRQNLTMDSSSSSESQNQFVGGNPSSINLRGLGDSQTLVLINGRRAPAGNLALNSSLTQPNLNAIPMGAVDRIEVLPTSASAIYGGGAVGGVINIVLKRDYRGGQIRVSWQNPDDTDAPRRRVEASYGFALEGGRTHVSLSTSYADEKLLEYQDRPFLRRYDLRLAQNIGLPGFLPLGATPTIRSASSANLVLKNGGSIGSTFTYIPYGTRPDTPAATLAAALRANAGQINRDLPTYSRQSSGGALHEVGTGDRMKNFSVSIRRDMSRDLEANIDFSISSGGHIKNGSLLTSQAVAASAPSNPFTTAVQVLTPFAGEWPISSANVSRQLSVGFIYKLPHDWRAQADYTWNSVSNTYTAIRPFTLASADITAALNAGQLNPFLDTTLYPFDLTAYQGVYSYTGSGGSNDVALRLAGPAWRLPAGAPRVGFGLENRQQGQGDSHQYSRFTNFPARNSQTDALGKSQTTASVYAEAQVPVVSEANPLPLIRKIDLQFAARTEDYDVGTGTPSVTVLPAPAVKPTIYSNRVHYRSTNPTLGASYKPVGAVLLRTSFGRGFVPPSYTQLRFDPTPSTSPTNLIDPRRGNERVGVFTIAGGNPALEPERSETWNSGIVITPMSGLLRGLRVSVDYNLTRKQNNIGSLSAQQLVSDEASYAGRVVRGAPAAGDPYGVGPIETVNTSPLNLYRLFMETFDFTVRYRRATEGAGTFSYAARGTFGNHYKRKVVLGFPMIEYANYIDLGPLKFQGNTSLTWDYGRFTVRASTRYYCKWRVPGPPFSALSTYVIPQGGEFVPSQFYPDFFIGYRFPENNRSTRYGWLGQALRGVDVQLNVQNVIKKVPVFAYWSNYNYDPHGNARLRDLQLSIKKPF